MSKFSSLKFVTFLALFSFELLSFDVPAIERSLNETISDNLRIQLLSTPTNSVHYLISFDNQDYDQQKLVTELNEFAFNNGIVFKQKSHGLSQAYAFQLPQEKLRDLNRLLSASLKQSANINISLMGDLNIQKQLGAMYSAWDNKKPIATIAKEDVFTKSIDKQLFKDKEAFWQTVLASLIYCDSNNLNQLNFRLSETAIECRISRSSQNVSDGDIAELKANFLDFLIFKKSSAEGLLELLNILEFDDNLDKLEELIAYLPQISIEKVSQDYHQLLSENGTRRDQLAEDTELDTDAFNNAHQISLSIKDIGYKIQYLALYLDTNYLELCAIVQCEEQTHLQYQFITKDPVLVLFKFEPESSEKLVDTLVKQIIRPLLNSQLQLSQEQLKIEFIGQDGAIANPLIQYSSLLEPANKIAMPTVNNLLLVSGVSKPQWLIKLDQLQLGDADWPSFQLYQYWFSYYLMQNPIEGLTVNPWHSLSNSLLSFESTLSADSLISALYGSVRSFNQSLQQEQFVKTKEAFLARIDMIDEASIEYQVISSIYQLPVKNYLTQAIDTLSFLEFKAYAEALIEQPNPAITTSVKSVQAIDNKKLIELIQTQASQ